MLGEIKSIHQERGIHFHSDFDVDEEMRFSAVQRDVDSKENENLVLDTYNSEQYRATFNSTTVQSNSDISRKKPNNQGRTSSSSSSLVWHLLSLSLSVVELCYQLWHVNFIFKKCILTISTFESVTFGISSPLAGHQI